MSTEIQTEHGTALLKRLKAYGQIMAPNQKERYSGKLLIQATAEIERLIGICTHVHDRLLRGDDDVELLAKLSEGWNGPKTP